MFTNSGLDVAWSQHTALLLNYHSADPESIKHNTLSLYRDSRDHVTLFLIMHRALIHTNPHPALQYTL